MKKTNKKAIGLLTAVLLTAYLTGCQSAPNGSSQPPESEVSASAASLPAASVPEPDTKTVVDVKGNAVELPAKIDRVAVSGALNQMVLILGQPQKIVATAEGVQNSFFATVYPGIRDVPAAYTGAGPGTLNVETLVAAKPQVMFGAPENQQAVLKNAGIVSLETALVTPDDIKKTLAMIAEVLGDGAPEKAKEFNEYYDKNLQYVSDATKDAEKVKVFVAASDGSGGGISTVGKNDIHTSYIAAAGGVNIVAEDAAFSNEPSPSVDLEYLIKAQPDVIIVSARTAYESIIKASADNVWQKLDAVKSGKVYLVPKGVYLWNVRSCEGALQPLFLASVLHPDLFPDLDLKQETRDFYSRFYSYNLTDEELELIFSQKT